jgi:hypothetical protein
MSHGLRRRVTDPLEGTDRSRKRSSPQPPLTRAPDLVTADGNLVQDIFVRDLAFRDVVLAPKRTGPEALRPRARVGPGSPPAHGLV